MAETVSTNQFRNGMHIELDGAVWRIVEFQHVKPGEGRCVRADEAEGARERRRRRPDVPRGEKFARVHTEVKSVQFLYDDGSEAHFMDEQTYEQFGLRTPRSRTSSPTSPPRAPCRCSRSTGSRPGSASRLGRARGHADGARRSRGHGHERLEAGDARDRRGRPGPALRRPWRADQGRSRARVATSAAPDLAARAR